MRLTPLESVLNRNIAASSAARALCQRLEGKVLALHVDGVPLSVYFESHGERMTLDTEHEGTPTRRFRGTPLALLRLAGPAPEAALRARRRAHRRRRRSRADVQRTAEGGATRSGGGTVARRSATSPPTRSAMLARSALGFARRAADTFAQNVAEYLQEEGRDVPSRTEAEEFVAGVDALRDDVDRLEARHSNAARSAAKRRAADALPR